MKGLKKGDKIIAIRDAKCSGSNRTIKKGEVVTANYVGRSLTGENQIFYFKHDGTGNYSADDFELYNENKMKGEIIGYRLKKDLPGKVLTKDGVPRKSKFPVGASVETGQDEYFDRSPEYWEPIYKEEDIKIGDCIVLIEDGNSGENTSEGRKGMIGLVLDTEAHNGCKPKDSFYHLDIPGVTGGGYDFPKVKVRKATKEEMKEIEDIIIYSYKASFTKDSVSFGCQTFTETQVEELKRLVSHPANAKITIGGVDISTELLGRILLIIKRYKNASI